MSRTEAAALRNAERGRVRQMTLHGAAVFQLCFRGRTPAEAGRALAMEETHASRALVYYCCERLSAAGLSLPGPRRANVAGRPVGGLQGGREGAGAPLSEMFLTVGEMDLACGIRTVDGAWSAEWLCFGGGRCSDGGTWRTLAWCCYRLLCVAVENGKATLGRPGGAAQSAECRVQSGEGVRDGE